MKTTYRLISYLLLVVFSLVNIVGASAQTVPVLGEIQSTGKVFINSSTGQWSPAMPTYPLLHDTGLKTEDGVASIFFKDGSRVDLSRNTIVSVASSPSGHSIKLTQGVVSFNVPPSSSLAIQTASAGIVASGGKEAVVGNITAKGTCLEVKSFTGDLQVTSPETGPKLVTSGENTLWGDCSVAAAANSQKSSPAYSAGEITAKYLILAGMGILAVDALLLKSPYLLK